MNKEQEFAELRSIVNKCILDLWEARLTVPQAENVHRGITAMLNLIDLEEALEARQNGSRGPHAPTRVKVMLERIDAKRAIVFEEIPDSPNPIEAVEVEEE